MTTDTQAGLVERLRTKAAYLRKRVDAAYFEALCEDLEAAAEALSRPASGVPEGVAVKDIAAERRRQVDEEGWSAERDDQYRDGALARAAGTYAINAGRISDRANKHFDWWPWSIDWWKPTTRRRDLVKAGALIVAEIERLDRQAAAMPTDVAVALAALAPQPSASGGAPVQEPVAYRVPPVDRGQDHEEGEYFYTEDRSLADRVAEVGLRTVEPLYASPPADTARGLAEALEPFATFAERNVDDDGWAGTRCERERIVDWFGPSDFRAALSAYRAAKGGRG